MLRWKCDAYVGRVRCASSGGGEIEHCIDLEFDWAVWTVFREYDRCVGKFSTVTVCKYVCTSDVSDGPVMRCM